ncbi:MAG: PHP domain-containing protein [Planctomycetes bacterium]|nr:PHP domain-containing protein [Planctomycetota bacterium]
MPFSANYHAHTWRCQHAEGDAVDYARVAAAGGCRVLGISDHVPMPDGRWAEFRMRMDQLDGYEAAVAAAQAAEPGLQVLLGMECELVPEFTGFYRDELLGRRGYDYLIGACHGTYLDGRWISSFERLGTPRALRAYADYAVRTLASGLFAFFAHPDIIGGSHADWNADTAACAADICAASAALRVPLEMNSYGFRKPFIDGAAGPRATYPWKPFWEVAAAHRVQVVLNSDAHRPQDVLAGYDELAAWRDELGLVEADLSALERGVRKSGSPEVRKSTA